MKATFNLRTIPRMFSDQSLTKKATLNAIGSMLDYMARMVVGLVINPFIVRGLGDYLYGVLQILGRLILYMQAASGRPTQALKWTIANQQSSLDFEAKRRNVGSALAVWALFTPIVSALGILLVWFAPTWLNAPTEVVWIIRVSAAIMTADLVLTTLADIPQSTLQGENLGYKRMGASTLIVLIGGGGFTAVALYFKWGLIGVVVADLAYTLVAGIFFFYVAKKTIPWFGAAKPVRTEINKFFGLSWWFFIWRLVNQLMMSSDVIVLGWLISVEGVTTYTLSKYIPETLVSLVAIVATGITPGLGGLIGKGNLNKAAQVRSEMMAGTWLVATIVGVTTMLWNSEFVKLWVGKERFSGDLSTLFIMLMVIQFVFIRNDANIIDLSLDLRYKVLSGAFSALLSIGFAYVFIKYFSLGVIGLCLGFMAGRLILSLGYPWFIGRFLGVSLSEQFAGTPRPAIVTVALLLLALAVGKYVTINGWFGLVIGAGLTTLAVTVVAFYAGLAAHQRKALWDRMLAVLKLAPENIDAT
jgi:O-antigen/teichoic acid export membrane protein